MIALLRKATRKSETFLICNQLISIIFWIMILANIVTFNIAAALIEYTKEELIICDPIFLASWHEN
jgi:hypothetical protein